MKRLAAALCAALIFTLSPPAPRAFAASARYARATTKISYLFSEKDETSALFAVPYTYCVEILGDGGEWYRCRYAADEGIYRQVCGWCRRADFEELDNKPSTQYLYKPVSVTYEAVCGFSPVKPADISVEAAFYGTYYSGAAAYSYVYCQGAFCYIPGEVDYEPLSPAFAQENGEQPEEDGGVNAGLVTVIVIAAAFVAAICALHFLTARPKRRGDSR